MFTWMEETRRWTFLPNAGGLLDQDEMLMENITRIASVVRKSGKKET